MAARDVGAGARPLSAYRLDLGPVEGRTYELEAHLRAFVAEDLGPPVAVLGDASCEEHDEAIADYTDSIRLDPRNATAFYNRGCSRREMGGHDPAIADFEEAA